MAKRDRADIRRAVNRLKCDGELIALSDLRFAAGASPDALRRWAIQGVRGVHLDAVHNPEKGWLSSWAALKRFQKQFIPANSQTASAEKARAA